MKAHNPILALIFLLLFSATATAALPIVVDGQKPPTLAPMLQQVTPAVVNIATHGRVVVRSPLFDDPFFRRFFDIPDRQREKRTQGLGSGVIIDAKNGHILTNHHVIENAELITVTLQDGRQLEAQLIGTDPETDVAVLQIKASELTALPSADSDRLQVGDFVVAIGNPFGLGQTVTSGIVSALGRSGLGIESYEDFIQTDASINPGNSGGALVNLSGELVGINTAILGSSGGNIGIGFAIPVNMALDIMHQLIKHGEIRRGRLGISAQDLTPELARVFGVTNQQGAVIAQIMPGSPADRAGVQVGDVVLAVNNRPVRNSLDIRNMVGLLRIGSEVKLHILRKNQARHISVVIAEPVLRKLDGKKLSRHLAGATLTDIIEGSRYFGQIEGVLLQRVIPSSMAGRAGLRDGDIILAANDYRVKRLDDLEKVIRQPNTPLSLNILRGNSELYMLLR